MRRAFQGALALALLLAGGASGKDGDGKSPAPPLRRSSRPVAYHRMINRVASLDPVEAVSVYASRSIALVYETLLEYDYEARPYRLRPGLAAAMPEVSEGGRVYTVSICTNAFYAPDPCFGVDAGGRPRTRAATAADFLFAFKRLADAKTPSSGYWLVEGRVKGIGAFHQASLGEAPTDYAMEIEGLRALDDHTLRIELEAPNPVFEWALAMPYLAATPPEAVAYYGEDFRDHPVGTGPYVLAEWRRNYRMRFARNPAWRGWGSPEIRADRAKGLHPFDEIVFPIIDDPSTQWLCFLAGELDLQGEVSRDNWDEVVLPDGSLSPKLAARGIRLHTAPTLEVGYIGLNMQDPVLGPNRKLRQALNAAFDAEGWERYYRGRAQASNSPVPPQVAGAVTNALPFGRGVDVAKRLLAEAGYPGGIDPATGKRLSLTLDVGKATQDMRESTELLVAYLDRCGIELKVEYHNWPAFLRKVSQRRSQMFRIGWVGDYPDAENFLQLFYSPNASPGPNRCNYSNPAFDELYRRAMATPDEVERLRLYGEMQRMLQEDPPWIFMSFSKAASLSNAGLERYFLHDFPYGMEKHLRHR